MKMFLLYGLTGTVLFAIAASVSLMFFASGNSGGNGEAQKNVPGKSSEKTAEKAEPAAAYSPSSTIKPGPVNPEELASFLNDLRAREKAVKEREAQLLERRKNMELVYQDVRGERAAQDFIRKQVSDEMLELNKKNSELEATRSDIVSRGDAIAMAQKKREDDYRRNDPPSSKAAGQNLEFMPPDVAARTIEQMANSGKMEAAAKYLTQIKQPKQAKILAEIKDTALIGQLLKLIADGKLFGGPVSAQTPGLPGT